MRYLRKAAKIQAMPQPKQAIVTTQLVSGDLKFPTARVNKSNQGDNPGSFGIHIRLQKIFKTV